MLKRQDSLLSSTSSRRDHRPLPQEKRPAKSIGCFAGIIHFLSKYQIGRRPKFLTFGKKQGESTKLQPSSNSELFKVSPTAWEKLVHPTVNAGGARFNANELPTNKIRPLLNHPSNSSLSEDKLPTTTFISSEETRRKLLDALDKCDNDLKEITHTVWFHEEKAHTTILLQEEDYSSTATAMRHGTRFDISEQPYELNRSAFNNSNINSKRHETPSDRSAFINSNIYSKRHETSSKMAGGRTHEQKLPQWKKPGESYADIRVLKKVAKGLLEGRYKQRTYSSFWSSKAMIKNVDEVCGDICSGEKREVRRLGSELQEFICGELIQEFITDFSSSQIYSLAYQKCKRRIHV